MKIEIKTVFDLIKILDEQSVSSKIQIKDSFGLTDIQGISYNEEDDTFILEID
jgi:hypothetical protein